MKVRVTYGLDKVADGAFYHEQHIINDLKALSTPATPFPVEGMPTTTVKGVDTEYDKDGNLLTVGFANSKLSVGLEWDDNHSKSISNLALRETNWLVGHNIPGDIDQLAKNGLSIKDEWYQGRKIIDTLVLSKMDDENKLGKGSYGLESLMLTEFNVQPWKTETDKKFKETGDARDWTPEEREGRCSKDAWATFMLAKKLYPKIAPDAQSKRLVETIHRISMTLYRIGLAGAKVDPEYLVTYKAANAQAVAQLQSQLECVARSYGWDRPEPYCPTKDDDTRHLLFELLKLEPIRYTKEGKPSVDKVSLSQYNETFTETLLAYNKVQKAYSVFNDIGDYIDKNGFIHFWINQLGARTGRRSSGGGSEGTPSGKNAQNWNKGAKKLIMSRFPRGKIGAFDYQSLEPILAAYLSKDSNLFDFFYNGRGYLDVCKRVLGRDIEKTSPIYRGVKSMTLGIFYNMQTNLMATNLWLGAGMDAPVRFSEDFEEHRRQVDTYRKQILKLFGGWVRYMERQKIDLEQNQQIVAPDGYIRHLPHHGPRSKNYWKLVNQSINFKVQHLASMVTGCAMIDCEEALLGAYRVSYHTHQQMLHDLPFPSPYSLLINEVHDELTWDLNPRTIEKDKELILEVMSRPPTLKKLIPDFDITLKIEPKVSDRW